MGNRTYGKMVYTAVLQSVKRANILALAVGGALEASFSHRTVGMSVQTTNYAGTDKGKLVLNIYMHSPADSKTLDLLRTALESNVDMPFTISGLYYDTITVEDATAEETLQVNQMEDEREEQAKAESSKTTTEVPDGLAAFVAMLEANGADVTVIRI